MQPAVCIDFVNSSYRNILTYLLIYTYVYRKWTQANRKYTVESVAFLTMHVMAKQRRMSVQ